MPPTDTPAKQQIAERLKNANNILVTVSTDPSVDQLAATIGFTLLLNKLGKHGTAVFSGKIPNTLEFLQPEATLEKNTDSLRDFIIALDKAKADKLRYKVEDKLVRIFITPYRTSLTEKDLEFSQGDFNVDVVVALGVQDQKQIDAAITAHGRILHDATVISINTHSKSTIGTINWEEPEASSLCEMLVSLGTLLGPDLFDSQAATAFLTGVVAETERFSNNKTSPNTMTVAAQLMSWGANQQLIASKLEKPKPVAEIPPKQTREKRKQPDIKDRDEKPQSEIPTKKEEAAKAPSTTDGTLLIDHSKGKLPPPPAPDETDESNEHNDQIKIDQHGNLQQFEPETIEKKADNSDSTNGRVLEPPSRGGQLTASTQNEDADPSTDPMSLPQVSTPLLSRDDAEDNDSSSNSPMAKDDELLSDIEKSVSSLNQPAKETDQSTEKNDDSGSQNGPLPDTDEARDAVSEALQSLPTTPDPIAALNAMPMHLDEPTPLQPSTPLMPPPPETPPKPPVPEPIPLPQPQVSAQNTGLPPNLVPPVPPITPSPGDNNGPATPPPPVPPPMMPPMAPPTEDTVNPNDPLAGL